MSSPHSPATPTQTESYPVPSSSPDPAGRPDRGSDSAANLDPVDSSASSSHTHVSHSAMDTLKDKEKDADADATGGEGERGEKDVSGDAARDPAPSAAKAQDELAGSADINRQPTRASQQPPRPYSSHSNGYKWFIVLCAAFASLASPISSIIVTPSLDTLATAFGQSVSYVTLSLTVYLIFQATAPSFVAPLSDSFGRRPVVVCCITGYVAACVGLALVPTTTFGGFLGLRVMQAIFGSPLIAIGAGIVADVATTKERGKYMGLYSGVAMFGPAFGPTLGGIFNQTLGWRAVFWFLVIFVSVILLIIVFALPETLRSLVGDGTIPPPRISRRPQDQWRIRQKRRARARHPERDWEDEVKVERPPKKRYDPLGSFKALLQPDVAALLLYAGMVFASMYAVLSTYSVKLENDYGFDTIESGLCYLPMGFGSLVTAIFGGRILDWDLKRTMKRVGFVQKHPRDVDGFAIERCRCHFLPISYSFMLFSMLIYGWSMEKHWPFEVALILNVGVGIGNQFTMQVCNILLVDLFPQGAGAITASFNLTRCLLAAGVTAFINPLDEKVGLGWALVIVCALSVAFSPALLYVMVKGPQARERRAEVARASAKRREEREREKGLA